MKVVILAVILVTMVVGTPTCPLSRPLKIAMYQYLPDLAGDGLAGLGAKLEAEFLAATGCQVICDYGFNVDNYHAQQSIAALKPCSVHNPPPTCGYDMVEIDTATLGDLTGTPGLIQPVPASVKINEFDFLPQCREMVYNNGIMWGQPSFACDNVIMSLESGLETEVNSQATLLAWINRKRNGNMTRLGYTTDYWNVWDMTTIYVDAFLDQHNFRPLCCGPGTAYYQVPDVAVATGLQQLLSTCHDTISNTNPCLDSTFYFDFATWFGYVKSGRSVMIQGFSSYVSNLGLLGIPPTAIQMISAPLGTGSKPYIFTDAFVLSATNCVSASCVAAAALWMNWQRLDAQLIINLGLDLATPTPRYLESANRNFYTNPLVAPYAFTYNKLWNTAGTGSLNIARPLNTQHFTDNFCELYSNLQPFINTGSSCSDPLQGYIDTP